MSEFYLHEGIASAARDAWKTSFAAVARPKVAPRHGLESGHSIVGRDVESRIDKAPTTQRAAPTGSDAPKDGCGGHVCRQLPTVGPMLGACTNWLLARTISRWRVARGRWLVQFRGVAGHPRPRAPRWNLLRPYGFQERSVSARRQPLAAKVAQFLTAIHRWRWPGWILGAKKTSSGPSV